MRFYAQSTPRFVTQLAADFAVVCWVLFWCWIGTVVHDGIAALADPGERVSAAASDLAGSLRDAGDFLDDAPVIGDGAAAPFTSAADASDAISDAGDSSADAAYRLAFWAGVLVAVVPIAMVGRRYVPWRVAFVREATATQRQLRAVGRGETDLELFAWRAVTTRPLHEVVRVSDDPVGAIRRGEAATVERLARLELDRVGMRPPPIGPPRGGSPEGTRIGAR